MTLYAGETVQVRHQAFDYDEGRLTDADIDVAITIWDIDGTTVLVDAPMAYDPSIKFEDGSEGGWFYVWATPAVAGAYRARCTATGDGISAWENKSIRLRQSPTP